MNMIEQLCLARKRPISLLRALTLVGVAVTLPVSASLA
jgi:hypothetical protein